MTWLFIDSRDRQSTAFGWLGDESAKRGASPRLWSAGISLIADLSRKIKLDRLRKADGICVVSGPGSFSSIRTGVLIANLLSRICRLPLYAVHADETSDLAGLINKLELGAFKPSSYVAPEYDREPNITMAPSI